MPSRTISTAMRTDARASALAAARLEDVEAPLLHRELDVLHVVIVFFEQILSAKQLIVGLGQSRAHRFYRLRCTDPRDDVFARGVEQYFAEELPLTRGGIARERDPGTRVFAKVAKDHGLHRDRCAQ
jgi:hypothetical protein